MRRPSRDCDSFVPLLSHPSNIYSGRSAVAARWGCHQQPVTTKQPHLFDLPLKLQARFASGVSNRLHAAVIEEPVAVEHHALDALVDEALGDRLADGLGARDV